MESSRKNKQMSKIEYLSMKMGSRIVALYQQNAGGDAQQVGQAHQNSIFMLPPCRITQG